MSELQQAQQTDRIVDTWLVKGNSHANLIGPMITYAESRGTAVYKMTKLVIRNEAVAGGYSRAKNIIYIDPSLPPNMQVVTLAHELAHSFAPTKDMTPGSPGAEVFAEAVACLVVKAFGLDVRKEAFAYITYTQYEGIYAMQLHHKLIEDTVDTIIAGIRKFQ